MFEAKRGDRLVVESKKVGQARRSGEVLEVIGSGSQPHYRVRWDDGHETTFFPSAGVHVEARKRR